MEEGLLLPLVGEFEELPVLVLVELEGEVEAADDGLGVGEVLADVGVDQVVPFEQGHCVEHYLLVLERKLVLPLSLAHEFDELLQVPLREYIVPPGLILEMPVVLFLLAFELLDFLRAQDPLRLHPSAIVSSLHPAQLLNYISIVLQYFPFEYLFLINYQDSRQMSKKLGTVRYKPTKEENPGKTDKAEPSKKKKRLKRLSSVNPIEEIIEPPSHLSESEP